MIRGGMLDTLVSSEFYELIEYYQPRSDELLGPVREMLPDGWQVQRGGVWHFCFPPGDSVDVLPLQGWKIHVSSTVSNATSILVAVVPILVEQGTSFKFALDLLVLSLMNGKTWAR